MFMKRNFFSKRFRSISGAIDSSIPHIEGHYGFDPGKQNDYIL